MNFYATLQVIRDKTVKLRILEACHDDRVGGCHFGRDRTIDKVTTRYYWKGIYKDTEEWVSTRLNCIVVCWLDEISCNGVHVDMYAYVFQQP